MSLECWAPLDASSTSFFTPPKRSWQARNYDNLFIRRFIKATSIRGRYFVRSFWLHFKYFQGEIVKALSSLEVRDLKPKNLPLMPDIDNVKLSSTRCAKITVEFPDPAKSRLISHYVVLTTFVGTFFDFAPHPQQLSWLVLTANQ